MELERDEIGLLSVSVARIDGVSAFAQPARERPALIRLRRRDDVEV
jgi:hypothetical protein